MRTPKRFHLYVTIVSAFAKETIMHNYIPIVGFYQDHRKAVIKAKKQSMKQDTQKSYAVYVSLVC